MTPSSPSSSDGPALPPRHRPALGDLAQDTTEKDLWAFDDDLDADDLLSAPVEEPERKAGNEIPAPREISSRRPAEGSGESSTRLPVPGTEQVRMDVRRKQEVKPAGEAPGPSKPESDFDDLEAWEDTPVEADIVDLPRDPVPGEAETEEPVKPEPKEDAVEAPATVPESAPVPAKGDDESDDEFSTPAPEGAAPVDLRPHLGLSNIERIGLIVLLVLLVGGGAVTFLTYLNRLPSESTKLQANDFPVKGELITVQSAESYWREPITGGDSPDAFRMGTELLPVLKISVKGGPAAIRVLFKNEEKEFVGDAVTRSIRKDGLMEISATAGFDDPGMHAAYRTGESDPWTIEVYEAVSEDVAGRDDKMLFEMNVSTDRR
jgi:hypothetical protein